MNAGCELIAAAAAADAAPEAVGGKGRQLGLLRRYGLPVPDFFVIPAVWSEQRRQDMPAELVTPLRHELLARGWNDRRLAVRFSVLGDGAHQELHSCTFSSDLAAEQTINKEKKVNNICI